jgi:4-alpha-glucanotransferase
MPTKPTLAKRASGVLLHPTSLSGPDGGGLGLAAREFIDFLADSGQSWWQVLPVCPPDNGGSPYNSISSFAGSPDLISPEVLVAEGLIKKIEASHPQHHILRLAAAQGLRHLNGADRDDFHSFRRKEEFWLADHSLFCALKDHYHGLSWTQWPISLRQRESSALTQARLNFSAEIEFHDFVQWLFARQWRAIRLHAAARGISLMGDAPIYVSHESADCWAHQDLFFLNESGLPTVVAGVPPDYFSKTGQLWGNPIYNWERHSQSNFSWWVSRLKTCAERFDAVRLDHFIAFRNYWEIPSGEKTAVNGRWVQAPGDQLFEAVRRDVPALEIVAEDLGTVTPAVTSLREKFSFPGMKVGQFSFGGSLEDRPSHWPRNCVGYTGTHDNDTTRGWFEDRSEASRREREAFLQTCGHLDYGSAWAMIRLVWRSPAHLVIAPMQDLLGLGREARMNLPGSSVGNWSWRMESGAMTRALAGRLGTLTGATGRAPEDL